MVATIFLAKHIPQGRKLLEKLPDFGFSVVEAFWYQFPDSEDWRFVIASPKLRKLDPLAAYTALRDILRKTRNRLTVSDITFLSPDDSEYRRLRDAALGYSGGRAGDEASRITSDVVFSDAYQYALPAAKQGARPR